MSIQLVGVFVITKDGKLITAEAASDYWEHPFFHTTDPELDSEYSAYLRRKSPSVYGDKMDAKP